MNHSIPSSLHRQLPTASIIKIQENDNQVRKLRLYFQPNHATVHFGVYFSNDSPEHFQLYDNCVCRDGFVKVDMSLDQCAFVKVQWDSNQGAHLVQFDVVGYSSQDLKHKEKLHQQHGSVLSPLMERISDLKTFMQWSINHEDFHACEVLNDLITHHQSLYRSLQSLQTQKRISIKQEDFKTANHIKNQINALKANHPLVWPTAAPANVSKFDRHVMPNMATRMDPVQSMPDHIGAIPFGANVHGSASSSKHRAEQHTSHKTHIPYRTSPYGQPALHSRRSSTSQHPSPQEHHPPPHQHPKRSSDSPSMQNQSHRRESTSRAGLTFSSMHHFLPSQFQSPHYPPNNGANPFSSHYLPMYQHVPYSSAYHNMYQSNDQPPFLSQYDSPQKRNHMVMSSSTTQPHSSVSYGKNPQKQTMTYANAPLSVSPRLRQHEPIDRSTLGTSYSKQMHVSDLPSRPGTQYFQSPPQFDNRLSSSYNRQLSHGANSGVSQSSYTPSNDSKLNRKIGQIHHDVDPGYPHYSIQRIRDAAKRMLQEKAMNNTNTKPAKVVLNRSRLNEMLKKQKELEKDKLMATKQSTAIRSQKQPLSKTTPSNKESTSSVKKERKSSTVAGETRSNACAPKGSASSKASVGSKTENSKKRNNTNDRKAATRKKAKDTIFSSKNTESLPKKEVEKAVLAKEETTRKPKEPKTHEKQNKPSILEENRKKPAQPPPTQNNSKRKPSTKSRKNSKREIQQGKHSKKGEGMEKENSSHQKEQSQRKKQKPSGPPPGTETAPATKSHDHNKNSAPSSNYSQGNNEKQRTTTKKQTSEELTRQNQPTNIEGTSIPRVSQQTTSSKKPNARRAPPKKVKINSNMQHNEPRKPNPKVRTQEKPQNKKPTARDRQSHKPAQSSSQTHLSSRKGINSSKPPFQVQNANIPTDSSKPKTKPPKKRLKGETQASSKQSTPQKHRKVRRQTKVLQQKRQPKRIQSKETIKT